jgi:hypothetical protein
MGRVYPKGLNIANYNKELAKKTTGQEKEKEETNSPGDLPGP